MARQPFGKIEIRSRLKQHNIQNPITKEAIIKLNLEVNDFFDRILRAIAESNDGASKKITSLDIDKVLRNMKEGAIAPLRITECPSCKTDYEGNIEDIREATENHFCCTCEAKLCYLVGCDGNHQK